MKVYRPGIKFTGPAEGRGTTTREAVMTEVMEPGPDNLCTPDQTWVRYSDVAGLKERLIELRNAYAKQATMTIVVQDLDRILNESL